MEIIFFVKGRNCDNGVTILDWHFCTICRFADINIQKLENIFSLQSPPKYSIISLFEKISHKYRAQLVVPSFGLISVMGLVSTIVPQIT